ncbi:unnamed protein product, partial [Ilex paraguariensis]
DLGLRKVEVKTDSYEAYTLLSQSQVVCHSSRVLIAKCTKLLRESNSQITHLPREENQCADALENLGEHQLEKFIKFGTPPTELNRLLETNLP